MLHGNHKFARNFAYGKYAIKQPKGSKPKCTLCTDKKILVRLNYIGSYSGPYTAHIEPCPNCGVKS